MTFVNGVEQNTVSALDRGLAYGDGVFRTLLLRGGMPLCWNAHYRKLASDCTALQIACPDDNILRAELRSLGERDPECVAKIIITRGEGGRGYAPQLSISPTRIVLSSPLPHYPDSYAEQGVKVRICDMRLAHQPQLAGVKHLNRLENVLARMEWNDAEIAEGLLCDTEGDVIEGVMSNLFVLHGDMLSTPDLSNCGVAGVQRERILALASPLGLQTDIKKCPLDFVIQADAVLLCNSVIGVWQIRELDGKIWQALPLVRNLRNLLNEAD